MIGRKNSSPKLLLGLVAWICFLAGPGAKAYWTRDETLLSISYVVESDMAKSLSPMRCIQAHLSHSNLPLEGLHNLLFVEYDPCKDLPSDPFVLYFNATRLWAWDYACDEPSLSQAEAYDIFNKSSMVVVAHHRSPIPYETSDSRTELPVPMCYVPSEDSKVLADIEAGASSMTISVQNGEAEHVAVHSDKSSSSINVYADGELLHSTPIRVNDRFEILKLVHETYRIISFVADAGTRWATVAVTDGYTTTENSWYCASLGEAEASGLAWMHANSTKDILTSSTWKRPPKLESVSVTSLKSFLNLNTTQISLHGFTGKVACRGIRGNAEILHRAKAYRVIDDAESWPKAEKKCLQLGMQLVSIHSFRDNRFVSSLIQSAIRHTTAARAWIGMKNEAWSDNSVVDFYAYNPYIDNEEYGTSDDNYDVDEEESQDQFMILRSANINSYNWLRSPLGDQVLPFVCQRFVEDSGNTFDSGQRCMWYMTGEAETEGQTYTPPKIRSGTSGLCTFGKSALSCCSDLFVDTTVRQRIEAIKHAMLSRSQRDKTKDSQACVDLIEQVSCFDCQANQGEYLSYSNGIRKVRVCPDTFKLIENTCAGLFSFLQTQANSTRLVEAFFEIILQTEHEAVKTDAVEHTAMDNCFRIDDGPPIILQRVPETTISPYVNEIRLTFSSSVRVGTFLSLLVLPYPSKVSDSLLIGRRLIFDNLFSHNAIRYATVNQENDTVVLDLTKDTSSNSLCIFNEGQYRLVLDGSGVYDLAGNLYVQQDKWILQSHSSCYEPNYSLVWFVVTCTALTSVIFVGMYIRHMIFVQRHAEALLPVSYADDNYSGSHAQFQRLNDNGEEQEGEAEGEGLNGNRTGTSFQVSGPSGTYASVSQGLYNERNETSYIDDDDDEHDYTIGEASYEASSNDRPLIGKRRAQALEMQEF